MDSRSHNCIPSRESCHSHTSSSSRHRLPQDGDNRRTRTRHPDTDSRSISSSMRTSRVTHLLLLLRRCNRLSRCLTCRHNSMHTSRRPGTPTSSRPAWCSHRRSATTGDWDRDSPVSRNITALLMPSSISTSSQQEGRFQTQDQFLTANLMAHRMASNGCVYLRSSLFAYVSSSHSLIDNSLFYY